MPEGYIENGNPSGFTRVIDGYSNANFIGYLNDWSIAKGTGIFFQDQALKYSGIYEEDNSDYYVYS